MKQTIIVGEGRALERADSTARERDWNTGSWS